MIHTMRFVMRWAAHIASMDDEHAIERALDRAPAAYRDKIRIIVVAKRSAA